MLSFRRPSTETINAFLTRQSQLGFTYAEIGSTATAPPPGYTVDQTRATLGNGEHIFLRAKAGLARWNHFALGWVEASPVDTPIKPGEVVAVLAHTCGLWFLSACRIVSVVDEVGPIHRFGFAYGTLPEHVESGEERFVVEWDRQSDKVFYDILAFSRPHHPLARLGSRFARRVQKRFGRDSATAMRRVVE